MGDAPTNSSTSTSDPPPDGNCTRCGAVTKPFLVPAIFDQPAKWIRPNSICDSCHEELEEENKVKVEQERIESAFREAMITPRFRDRTFENFQVTGENKKAWEAAKHFRVIGDGVGLMFFGPYGIGKTHLAAAIANSHIGKMPVLYVSVPDLLAEIRDTMNKRGESSRLEMAKRVDLLVLDDIGAEKPSEWVRETLFVLVNHRYEYKLSTVLTTNCTMQELEERLGGRIVSRLVEMTRCIRFDGEDHRFERLKPKTQGDRKCESTGS